MRIPITNTKKRLAIIWFSGSGFLFALLFLQTIFGKYGTEAKDAWGLLLPTFMPTLSLIIGTLIADATASKKDTKEIATVDRFFFRLSCFLSIAYLLTVILTILLSPFSKLSLLELIKLSNLWLAPFQGLVTASLGAFFVSKK
ncbi:MAG: hypothetical protein D3919_02485 [Candidatus Electrothrix sp. AW5]|nr:hypothetical protein [Candidatus Electrothrix sp. AX1]MCI5180424.1 hypothetical protein [Candidatus Electrothrix gigas]MCI5181012.1 hypothetical protein [Candidatus Electrothrix gigas]MCI5195098.1 hypothetical protein [Candidatus Electrothrix gigas]MCI5226735.1 hypothetical protein [Candidatus Electrothrix gigas]